MAVEYIQRLNGRGIKRLLTPALVGVVPAALTKADDTNVTLALSGTPATALLQSVQISLGWTGQLSITRGGTGASSASGARVNILPSLAGNTLKVLRVNAGETDVEWVAASGGESLSATLAIGNTTGAYDMVLSDNGGGALSQLIKDSYTGASRFSFGKAGAESYAKIVGESYVRIEAGTSGISVDSLGTTLFNSAGNYAVAINSAYNFLLATTGVAEWDGSDFRLGLDSATNGKISFFNNTNSNTISLRSGVSSSSFTLILPTSDSTGTQALVSNGSGVLSWATMSAGVSDGDKGDITVSGSGATWTIDNNVVTYAKFQQVAALSVVGNSTNALANSADISAGSDYQILRRSGTAIGFGSIDLSQSNAVGTSRLAYANITQLAGLSVLGVTGTSTADVAALTGTANQVLRVNGAGTSLAFGQLNLSSPSAVTGTLASAKGGTDNNTYTIGDLLQASASTTLSVLNSVSAGSYLRSGGVGTANVWSTLKLPNTATSTYIAYATSSNTIGESGNLLYDGTQFITPKHAGSAASGQNLTLVSTTHATKGKILLGTLSAYDEVNDSLGIGTTTPYSGTDQLRIEKSSAAAGRVSMRIKNNTATGFVQWTAEQGSDSTYLYQFGSSYATSGRFIARNGLIEANYQLNLSGGDSSAGAIRFYTRGNNLRLTLDTILTFADAVNIAAGTTTGTKIGTATTQKIGVWNATPIVQPTTAVAAATFVANTSAIANDTATFDGYTIGQVVKALRNIGLLA